MTQRPTSRGLFLAHWAIWLLLAALGACSKEAGPANEDVERRTDGARVLVVFVHGILGHATQTFSPASGQPWPQLLATDPELKAPIDVLSVAYTSKPLDGASNIHEIATRLLSKLQVERRVFERYDKVVFIAHSMGGLVVRRLLLQLRQDAPEAYQRVAGVFFMAVPAGGSDLAAGLSWVSKNPQFGNMTPEDANVFLQADADGWATLMRRRPTNRPYPRSFCAYETLATATVAIVPRSRSQVLCDESPNAFDRDHSAIVKPTGLKDDVHRFVVARLNRLIDDADVPLSVSIELLSPVGRPLPTGVSMRSGDQFSIRVQATRPAWLYLFGIDGKLRVERYFPSSGGGEQKAVALAATVPTDTATALTLDQTAGVEQFIAVATTAPDPKLAAWSSNGPASALSSEAMGLGAALEKRGAFVAQRKNTSSLGAFEHAIDVGPSGTRAQATLTFWHQ